MDDLPEDQMDEILNCIFAGRKIEAVKLYRGDRRMSLLDAKNFIDRLEQELRESSPEKFQASRGCAAAVLLLVSVSSLLAGAIGWATRV